MFTKLIILFGGRGPRDDLKMKNLHNEPSIVDNKEASVEWLGDEKSICLSSKSRMFKKVKVKKS